MGKKGIIELKMYLRLLNKVGNAVYTVVRLYIH